MRSRLLSVAVLAAILGAAGPAVALPIQVSYSDDPNDGFLDSDLGAARRAAFEFAVGEWSRILAGDTPIVIATDMQHLGGTGDSALLARGGAVTLQRNFMTSVPNTWYVAALANVLAERDVNGPDAEIQITFNADVDNSDVLGSIGWYYGTDAQADLNVDFVTIALHEIGHGLGFVETVDLQNGQWTASVDAPSIFDRFLIRSSVGSITELREAERIAAFVSPNLLWSGSATTAFNGSMAALFTPDPPQPGTSVAHWDPAHAPGELMGPFNDGPNHDPGLLLPALADMGWRLAVPSPTARSSVTTVSPTPTSTPVPEPTANIPFDRQDYLYVTDFDGTAVAIVNPKTFSVVSRVTVGNGSINAAASIDGRRVYVSNFHDGTVSVISTRTASVLRTIPVGVTANGVALTPDGTVIVVTDTLSNSVVVVDAQSGKVRARVSSGLQPTAVAITPDGNAAFVVDYGTSQIAMIDLRTNLRRAILPSGSENQLSIALSDAGFGYVASVDRLISIDWVALTAGDAAIQAQETNESVAVRKDGTQLYVAGNRLGNPSVARVDTDTRRIATRSNVGMMPTAMALSSDEKNLYVANAGSGSVSFIDMIVFARNDVSVGGTPMGLAVAAVPKICDGDCDADGDVTVDELLASTAIALEQRGVNNCIAADHNDDGTITIDEITMAIHAALSGCPS